MSLYVQNHNEALQFKYFLIKKVYNDTFQTKINYMQSLICTFKKYVKVKNNEFVKNRHNSIYLK